MQLCFTHSRRRTMAGFRFVFFQQIFGVPPLTSTRYATVKLLSLLGNVCFWLLGNPPKRGSDFQSQVTIKNC